jgi:hypothetical protein
MNIDVNFNQNSNPITISTTSDFTKIINEINMTDSIKKLDKIINLKSGYNIIKDSITITNKLKNCIYNATLIDKHNKEKPFNKIEPIVDSNGDFLYFFLTKLHFKNIIQAFSILKYENISFSISCTSFYITILTHMCDINIEIKKEFLSNIKSPISFNSHAVTINYKKYNYNQYNENACKITYNTESDILIDFDYLPILKKILKEVYYPKYTEYTAEQHDMSNVTVF